MERRRISLLHDFIAWSDVRKEEVIRSLVDNPPDNLIEALLQNKDLYSQKLWYKYSQTPEYKESVKRKSYRCKVSYKRNGLAAHLYARCSYCTKKLPSGHQLILQTPAKEEGVASNKNAAYDLNKKLILAAHALGTSWFGLRRALSIFGVNYLSQGLFEQCETLLGAALKDVTE